MSTTESNLKKLLRGKKGCNPQDHLYTLMNKTKTFMKGSKGKKLGEGQYGKVYRGSINDGGKRYVAYKEIKTPQLTNNMTLAELRKSLKSNPAKMEYTIAKKLQGFGVPETYLYKECPGKQIVYTEVIDGTDLRKWLKTKPTLDAMKSVIVQTIYNLYRIHKKHPNFRHHDLHGENVLVRKVPKKDIKIILNNKSYTISNGGVEPVMIDFGFAVFPHIKNPLINDNNYKNIGISRKSHKLYDVHFFLKDIFHQINQPSNMSERKVYQFIRKLFPDEYMKNNSPTYLKNARLRGNRNAAHTLYLPGFEKVLKSPFFTGETQLSKAIPKLPPTTVPRVVLAPVQPKTPVNKAAAYARAVAVMKTGVVRKKRPGIAK